MKSKRVIRGADIPPDAAFLTKRQLAAAMQVSVRTITELMKEKRVPFLRLKGRLVRFRMDDVNQRLTETVLVREDEPGKETS